MRNLSLLVLLKLLCPDLVLSEHRVKSDRILIKYAGTEEEAKAFGETLGLRLRKKILDNYGWYEFTKPDLKQRQPYDEIPEYKFDMKKLRSKDKKLKAITQEEYFKRVKKELTINDANWSEQWHLDPYQSPSMNVYYAWTKGFTGSGVTIAIVDDGIDTDHSDLAFNYHPEYSYDYIGDKADTSHKYAEEGHGTNCAGVAGAAKNSHCVIGVAYTASLAAIRILDPYLLSTASDEARALTHALSHIDVYSNSWGPPDNGIEFSGLSLIQIDALKKGVTEGRNGLGAIYVWASGNGGENSDDCNADGYASSPYTIAIAAVAQYGSIAAYSEYCSAVLAATYSGGNLPGADIATTGPSDTCVNDFSGTSAATPAASGIIALTLQAKFVSFYLSPDLTWRDIQHIIVANAVPDGLNEIFEENGARKSFSYKLGFGLMNAKAMVETAPSWKNVPSYTTCTTREMTGPASLQSGTNPPHTYTYTYSDCYISFLENVIVWIDYEASHRGNVQFDLTSPSRTRSRIFSQRDLDNATTRIAWEFLSVHFWGEDPNGEWRLEMKDADSDTVMTLYSWKMYFSGTVTDPLAGKPEAGVIGSSCTSSDDCDTITDGGCLIDGKICVVCAGNYRTIGSFCVQDGHSKGYCNECITCITDHDECLDNVCEGNEDDECIDDVCKGKEKTDKTAIQVKGKINTMAIIVGCIVALCVVIMVVVGIASFKRFYVCPTASVSPVTE